MVGLRSAWWPVADWVKARERVGVAAVEATQIIGLGARQGGLHDQCNYPQRQNRPEQPGLRHLGNASCEHNVLIFHKLIFFLVLAFRDSSLLSYHFWPFTGVLRKVFGSLTWEVGFAALNR